MDVLEFENLIKQLDKNKYHIYRALQFNKDNKPYIAEWSIFRKNMSTEEYFDPNNLAVLSSKNRNTLKDIERLIKNEQ